MHMYVSSLRVHCWLRWAFGPFSGNIHRLTSPKVRTFHVFSPVRTTRKSAPFRVGYVRMRGPIRPITGRHSLFPSSPTLCSVPLPYGRDTTCVGSIGLTQLSMKKNMSGTVGVCTPVRVLDVAAPMPLRRSYSRTILVMAYQPLWPLGHSRGFMMTLHFRSTLPAFPSLPPRRGWQRSEHCPQSFAPQITRQHVWVGTPGHRRAHSGSTSPCARLLHKPYEVSPKYDCAPPGHRGINAGASPPWLAAPNQSALPKEPKFSVCFSTSAFKVLPDRLPVRTAYFEFQRAACRNR
jgi:hypothetical protein